VQLDDRTLQELRLADSCGIRSWGLLAVDCGSHAENDLRAAVEVDVLAGGGEGTGGGAGGVSCQHDAGNGGGAGSQGGGAFGRRVEAARRRSGDATRGIEGAATCGG